MSKMFEFVTATFNLLGGKCPYECVYCWARSLASKFDMKKYQGEYFIDQKLWTTQFKEGAFIFLCDMLDFSAAPPSTIVSIFKWIEDRPDTKVLLMTKNPKVYLDYYQVLPDNAVLGATIESNRDCPSLSKAPVQMERIYWMAQLSSRLNVDKKPNYTFIAIEPILDFDIQSFEAAIRIIKPWSIAIGLDNYNHHLPEPELEKTMQLIERCEKYTTVYRKTLRKAWNRGD